jgi:hypothetical protein
MTPPDDIINDAKIFVSLWKEVAKKIKEDSDNLTEEYGVIDEEFDYDDGSYTFVIDGVKYKWDENEEELSNDEKLITSGSAHEYVIKNYQFIRDAYHIVESEMTKRGWYYDQEEYEYYISKNGWSTTLPYFCESVGELGEFEWDAEMLE